MKDLIRLQTSLIEEIEAALNEQIRLEALSASKYLAMASWCERNGYEHSAEFFEKQSQEEREHMLKLYKYINDRGGNAFSPEVKAVEQEYESFREPFEKALEQEIAISQAINLLADKCYKAKDYTTANFLNWFLAEQVEEEYVARRCLELFDVIGEEGVGKFMIDQEVAKVEYK